MVFGFMGNFFNPYSLLSWMFEHDCLDKCCFGCLLCMCFVFLYLHLLSAFEQVSHGKTLYTYAHYYYYYYYHCYHYHYHNQCYYLLLNLARLRLDALKQNQNTRRTIYLNTSRCFTFLCVNPSQPISVCFTTDKSLTCFP